MKMLLIVMLSIGPIAIEGFLIHAPYLWVLADFWVWQFLGRLHPMIVHFPIGLLFVALLLELLTMFKKYSNLRPAVSIVLLLGVISAIIAVVFGWLLQTHDQYSGEILDIHK